MSQIVRHALREYGARFDTADACGAGTDGNILHRHQKGLALHAGEAQIKVSATSRRMPVVRDVADRRWPALVQAFDISRHRTSLACNVSANSHALPKPTMPARLRFHFAAAHARCHQGLLQADFGTHTPILGAIGSGRLLSKSASAASTSTAILPTACVASVCAALSPAA